MKHLKLFFALFAMLALGVGNAWGAEAEFGTDWNSVFGTSYSGSISGVKANQLTLSGTVNSVSLVATNGTSTNGYVKTSDWRLYNGYTLTLTAPANHNITAITAKKGDKTISGISTTVGNLTIPSGGAEMSWTGSSNQVVFSITATMGFSEITVTYSEGSGSTPEPEPDPDPTPDPEPDPEPGTGGGETWTLVTNASDLKVGDQVVIAAKDYNVAISTTQNSNNRGQATVTKSGDNMVITFGADVQVLTLEAGTKSNTFGLNTGNGYLYAASSSGNQMKTQTTNNDNGSWSISISNGTATIKANGTNSRNVMQYNQSSSLFACYSSASQKALSIYKKVTSSGGETPEPVIVKTLKSIAVTGMKTTYEQGDIFKFNGTCTATYSVTKDGVAQADETAEVTPTSVSTPNMNTIGTQTVTVTYSEGGVEKTAEYQITITENTVTAGEYCITPNNEFWGTNFNGTISGDALNQVYTGRQDDITVQYSKGSGSNLYINNTQTRTYNGTALTIFAPNGYVITAIAFTADGSNWAGTHTANVGTMTDSKNWAGSANEVTITFGGTCRVTKICVTYEAAPVEPVKTLTSIEITTPATQTTFWQGETFNHNGLVVTAHYSDAADEVVTPTVTGSTATAGTATVNVSYKEQSTSYTIIVKAIPNTKETAYTIADAYDIIDKLTTANGVFISGTISQIDSYSDQYKSITYWISADGTTTKQLQVYSGKGLESADFAAVTDLSVGDQVIVCGNLKKYSGTYEFDKNNYLASHTPTTKDPAGLAYATTEYTANVGEAFTTPELTNPHNLVVTYSTSDASKATVDVNTGAVTIVAAGEVTITASTTGDATHDAGSASYTITISNPAMAVATLPFAFDNGKADIENTPGMSQNGLGSDYGSAPLLKFDGTGDYVIIHFDREPGKLSYDIKGNSYSGGTFTAQESEDGSAYTNIVEYTELGSTETKTHTLAATSRYVKFIYTNKSAGNVALGNIKIALPSEEPEQPGEGGGETPEERLTDWVLTPLADITTNDLVVITMTKGETTWAMTNNNGTTAAPAAPVVTLSADALAAEPDANLKWVVSNDNGTLTIYPYGTYETWLYCTNANNGVRVGTGDAKEFTIDTDHLYTTLTNEPRYLGVYDADADTWRCYTSINSNIEGQTLAFYVKKNANDVLPGTGEDPEGGEGGEDPVVPTPTINATATFIFNTAEGLSDLGITYPVTPTTETDGTTDAFKTEFENNATFTQDGITMTTTGGTVVATRVWLTKNGALDLRVYKGATLTFSVPAEHKISAIVFEGSNIDHLLVNGNTVSGNAWTGSEQTITFTAKADASTIKINTIAFVVEYTRNVTNKFGTICLPHASASTSGAYFYEVVGQGTENGKPAVYLASVNSLKAGIPYIFEKTANTIKVVYSSEKVDAPQNGDANGLVGTFEEIEVPNGMYILYNDAFRTNEPAGTLNKIRANRAYLNLDAVEGGAPVQMPGRRYIGMSVQGENEATGFENITAPEGQAIKVIENGQLIIIRGGEKFNVQGQKL